MFCAQLCTRTTRAKLVIVSFISLCFTAFLLQLLLFSIIIFILVSANKLCTCVLLQTHCDTLLFFRVSCLERLMQNILFCFSCYEFRFLSWWRLLSRALFFSDTFYMIIQHPFPLLYAFKRLRNIIGRSCATTLAVHWLISQVLKGRQNHPLCTVEQSLWELS